MIIGLGERLRRLREEKGLSIKQVADRVGRANSSIINYELDAREPSLHVLIKLATLYDTTVDYILGRTNDKSAMAKLRLTPELQAQLSEMERNIVNYLEKKQ